MTLEFTLLMAFIGVLFVSAIGDSETGLLAQFNDNKPALAIRMEKQMTIGKCFEVPTGGGQPCSGRLWQGPAAP